MTYDPAGGREAVGRHAREIAELRPVNGPGKRPPNSTSLEMFVGRLVEVRDRHVVVVLPLPTSPRRRLRVGLVLRLLLEPCLTPAPAPSPPDLCFTVQDDEVINVIVRETSSPVRRRCAGAPTRRRR